MAVEAVDPRSGQTTVYRGDWFFSTMPVKELVRALDVEVPAEVRQVSEGLIYRDFITVGLLLKELKVREDSPQGPQLIRDNWIYIQEPDVLVGRLQIFNNWSPLHGLPIARRSGWGWSISATRATICGRCRTRN